MSKPGKVLKELCKKLGVRLTVKRGKKRVYKSVKVLKLHCKRKFKRKRVVKKKMKVKRRKARFGAGRINFNDSLFDYSETKMSSTYEQRKRTQDLIRIIYPYQKPLDDESYFESGYNPFDIDNFSKNLLNDSFNDPSRMVELLMSADGDSLGAKSINYLIHNDFFKTREVIRRRTGDNDSRMKVSPEIMLLSGYILGNYHNEVPFKREDIGTPLINEAITGLSFHGESMRTQIHREKRARDLIKKYLWHSDLYEINWHDEDMKVYNFPLGTGVKTEECLRREAIIEFIIIFGRYPTIADRDRNDIMFITQDKFKNRKPMSIDEILYEINDREIKAKDFFIREHMSKYTNEVINNTNNLDSWNLRDNELVVELDRGDHSVLIKYFLKRTLKDYIFLCHRLRVRMLSHYTIKNTKDNGDISYNFVTDELRLCTCEDFYYRKFSNKRGDRNCKHLARTPKPEDNFEFNFIKNILLPGSEQASPTKQMYYNILRLERPEMLEELGIHLDDKRYFGSRYVIEGLVRDRLQIPREDIEGLVARNIVSSGEDHCYICLERPNFVLKNCPAQCRRSKICLDCLKQYPRDWFEDTEKIKCGMCRDFLRNEQIVDFNIMKKARNFNQDIVDKIGKDLQLGGTPGIPRYFHKIRADQRLETLAPGLARHVRSRPGGQVYFGKKKKKASVPASLKKVCKRLKIRLTVKRKGKRVYKSVKVLKELCKKALKKKVLRKSKAGKKRKVVKKRKKVVRKKKKVVKKKKKVLRKSKASKKRKVVKKKKVVRKKKKT